MGEFTEKKRGKFIMKYLKEHILEFLSDMILNIICIILIVTFCDEPDYYIPGIILAVIYSVGKSVSKMIIYKRTLLNTENI